MAGLLGVNSGGTSAIFLVWIMSCLVVRVWTYQRTLVSQCVPIREPLCQGNYNNTSFPNILGHENHEEASARLAEFKPLIKNTCSQHIQFFLCSLHFPMCDQKIPYGIPACQEMCDGVRVNCEPYLKAFHFEWPETIQCSKLPPASSHRCLVPRSMAQSRQEHQIQEIPRDRQESSFFDDIPRRTSARERSHRKRPNRKQNGRRKNRKLNPPTTESRPQPPIHDEVKEPKQIVSTTTTPTTTTRLPDTPKLPPDTPVPQTDTPIQQPETPEPTPPNNHRWSPISIDQGQPHDQDLERQTDDYYDDDSYNKFVLTEEEQPKCKNEEKYIFVKKINACLPICDVDIDVMFSSRDKKFMYYWMMACSILCFVSSAFTVGTFLVDSKRFRYPERPIIFLSLCYLLYATAYLVRLGRGPTGTVSCVTMDGNDVDHLIMGDLESTGCTAVFFLLYYFGMAASAWWVVLSVTWFLAAGLKWGHEAIESNGFCFHLAAWLLPAIQTIVVLVLGKVDGDELTGLCYVGNLKKDSLVYFIIIPLMTYLGVGALALGAGFCSLLKIRRVMRKTGDDPVRLEKLILKIGIFTVLYIVPTSCVVAVNVYQYNNANHWMSRAESRPCYPPGFLSESAATYRTDTSRYRPYYTQRYQDYNYDDSYMSQSSDYPSFAYRGYEDRLYPDIHQAEYSSQAYDKRTRYRRNRFPYAAYRQARDGSYRAEALDRGPHQQRSIRTNDRRLFSRDRHANMLMSNRDCHLAESIPSFPIFAIKIFMSLLAGITSGIWVWSGKTYKSWKLFCKSPWCGRTKSSKGSPLTVNTPQATSSGNLHAAPSVTSHLLSKSHPVPDSEYPYDNRFSFPAQTPDLYHGYYPVNQDDDDVTRHMTSSKNVTSRKTNALTLGDIAREYSDNLDSEMTRSPRNFYPPPVTLDDVTFYKHSDDFKETKRARKKAPSSVTNSRPKRATPNDYVHSRPGRLRAEPSNYLRGPYHAQLPPDEKSRIRKYSESDVNRLNLVSQSGFDPITSSTRRKAESAHVRCTQRI